MSKYYDQDGKELPPGFDFFVCSACGDKVSATGQRFTNKETSEPECTPCHFGIVWEEVE